MFTTFSTALSALNANATAVDVVGNDLANLNTTGYKTTQVAFRDLMAETLGGGNRIQVGLGTGRPLIIRSFTQGGLQTGAGPLDAAFQGQGFFVVNDSKGVPLFTRDGTFTMDAKGYLVTTSGQKVQGWTSIAGVLNTNGPTGDIVAPGGALQPPVVTKNMTLNLNLNSSAAVGSTDGTFSQTIQVYDTLGQAHNLTATFTKTGSNAWDYSVTIPGADLTGGKAGTPSQVAKGSLTFDSSGNLLTPAAAKGTVAIAATGLTDGAADLAVTWNLYDTSNISRLTQVDAASAVSASSQDGAAASQLLQVSMGDGGVLTAQYSNGQQVAIGQVAVAAIRNPDSLVATGSNDYQVSSLTAPPVIGTAGTGGRGEVMGGALEQSTVDIGQEFTSLITLQRAYQANSRVITTADQITQETVNLIHS